jgi:hypothetical protein
MKKLLLLTILAAGISVGGNAVLGADNPTDNPTQTPQGTTKVRRMPFRGKIARVDKKAKTVALKGRDHDRLFYLKADSKIKRKGKSATIDDVVVGESVGGLAKENDGKWEIVTLNLGGKSDDTSGEESGTSQL